MIVFAGIAATFAAISLLLFLRTAPEIRNDRLVHVFLFCLLYAAIAPRLKDYEFIIAIPATYWVVLHAIDHIKTYRTQIVIFLLVFCGPLVTAMKGRHLDLIDDYFMLGQVVAALLLMWAYLEAGRRAVGTPRPAP